MAELRASGVDRFVDRRHPLLQHPVAIASSCSRAGRDGFRRCPIGHLAGLPSHPWLPGPESCCTQPYPGLGVPRLAVGLQAGAHWAHVPGALGMGRRKENGWPGFVLMTGVRR